MAAAKGGPLALLLAGAKSGEDGEGEPEDTGKTDAARALKNALKSGSPEEIAEAFSEMVDACRTEPTAEE